MVNVGLYVTLLCMILASGFQSKVFNVSNLSKLVNQSQVYFQMERS